MALLSDLAPQRQGILACPSSGDLRRAGRLRSGGSGPSRVRLGGACVVVQAPGGGGLALEPGPLGQDGLAPAVVGVGRGEAATALVGPDVVVAFDEGADLLFEGAGQVAVLEQGEEDQEAVQWTVSPTNVLQGLVPALDLAPRVWGWRGAPRTWVMPWPSSRSARSPLPGPRRWCSTRCRSSSRGRCRTVTWSSPAAASARSSVSTTSSAFIVAQSFQATARREKSSSTVERWYQPQPVTFR